MGTSELALLVALCVFVFNIYQGMSNIGRNKKTDDKNEAKDITTANVKLDNITSILSKIEIKIGSVEKAQQADHDKIIIIENESKMAHKRLDMCPLQCKHFNKKEEE